MTPPFPKDGLTMYGYYGLIPKGTDPNRRVIARGQSFEIMETIKPGVGRVRSIVCYRCDVETVEPLYVEMGYCPTQGCNRYHDPCTQLARGVRVQKIGSTDT